MEAERPLETPCQDIGQQEKRRPIFNQYHRQMLDPLRDRDWVSSSKLTITPEQSSPPTKRMDGATLNLDRVDWDFADLFPALVRD
jgi:hypothetical protein